jgi:hypothetical protein
MRSNPSRTLIVLLGLSLASCMLNLDKDRSTGGKVDLQEISINGEYAIGIPTYMTKATSLNDDASLQFQNIFKETYVIIIDEDESEFIQTFKDVDSYDTTRSVISNYTDAQIQFTTSSMDVIKKTPVKKLKINGLHAASIEIDANIEGVKVPISYFLTFIEGNGKLYMIMAWTLEDKKDNHRQTFEQMAQSFKFLKKESKPV